MLVYEFPLTILFQMGVCHQNVYLSGTPFTDGQPFGWQTVDVAPICLSIHLDMLCIVTSAFLHQIHADIYILCVNF